MITQVDELNLSILKANLILFIWMNNEWHFDKINTTSRCIFYLRRMRRILFVMR